MLNHRLIVPLEMDDLCDFLMRYYSHRMEDIQEIVDIVEEAASAGRIASNVSLVDFAKRMLFEGRDDAYFRVRSLALEVLRSPRRFNTTSTGEGLALALLFDRKDWLGDETWAYAAYRVGRGWLEAIVQVEQDFKWMKLQIKGAVPNEAA